MMDPAEEHDPSEGDPGLLASGTIVGGYRIERALAQGGMATVYEATHTTLPRRAAIKVMHRYLLGRWATRERLLQEARILDMLDHPSLVRIYDAGVLDDDRPWLALELIEGVTLGQRMVVHGALEPLEVVEMLARVAGALDAAHAAGVVHRDLKPENIILLRKSSRLAVKVIDWGIARIAGETTTRLTRANMTPGTPFYMSPEQARGKPVDGRSDVYALGVIAYEALTGRLPFEGETPLDVVIQHLTAEAEPLRFRRAELPVRLDELVSAMLHKEPASRPTLDEVQEGLEEIARELRGEYDDVEIEIELEAEPAVLPRPRWTPRADQPAVAGEIVTSDHSRHRERGRAEALCLVLVALMTALMLACAIALPALADVAR